MFFIKLIILNYKIKFFLKKILFNKVQKDLLIFYKIKELSSKKNISLKKFLGLMKTSFIPKNFNKKILSFFFLKKKGIKKKFIIDNISKSFDYEKLYFYYKLFILEGWLCESNKIRKHLVNYKLKKNKNIIEKIKGGKKKFLSNLKKKLYLKNMINT